MPYTNTIWVVWYRKIRDSMRHSPKASGNLQFPKTWSIYRASASCYPFGRGLGESCEKTSRYAMFGVQRRKSFIFWPDMTNYLVSLTCYPLQRTIRPDIQVNEVIDRLNLRGMTDREVFATGSADSANRMASDLASLSSANKQWIPVHA